MNTRPSDAPTTEMIEDISKWPAHGTRFKVEEPVVDVSSFNSILFLTQNYHFELIRIHIIFFYHHNIR